MNPLPPFPPVYSFHSTEVYKENKNGACYTLGEVHGLLSGDAQVEVCRVPHLVGVAAHLDPVSNRVTVHPVHQVALVIHALAIVMRAVTWTQNKPSLKKISKYTNMICPPFLFLWFSIQRDSLRGHEEGTVKEPDNKREAILLINVKSDSITGLKRNRAFLINRKPNYPSFGSFSELPGGPSSSPACASRSRHLPEHGGKTMILDVLPARGNWDDFLANA